MTKCQHCGVQVMSQHKNCPLCSRSLESQESSITAYPTYDKYLSRQKTFRVRKIFLFSVLVGTVLAAAINFWTFENFSYFWSSIVIISLWYLWVCYRNTVASKMNAGGKVLLQLLLLSGLVIVIDISTGFSKWSTTYVVPFLSIATTAILIVFSIRRKANWQEYMGYLLAALFICFLPILLYLFHLSNKAWTAVAAIIFALLTVIGLIVFADKRFKEELRKRFHF